MLLSASSHATVIDYKKVVTTSDVSINENPGYVKKVVCSAGPFTVLAGDLITAHAQAEVTWAGSSATDRIMVGSGIIVATSSTAVDNTSAGYIGMVSKWAGNNFVKIPEGNEDAARTGSYQFSAAYTTVYVNWVHYGQTVPQYSAGPDAVIPAGYGEIIAVQERDVARYATTTYRQIPYDTQYYLPITGGFSPYVQYSYGPLNIAAGSMVDVRFQVEASTQLGQGTITQRLGRKVIQTTSTTSTTGTVLSAAIQGGATNLEHHYTHSNVSGLYFPNATNGVYFNSVLWAYGNATRLTIESESSLLYGGFAVEVRPYAGYWRDSNRNITTVDSTQRVLYSVGPINIPANQVVEVRYQAAFTPSANVAFDSKIVRASSPTSTSGTEVQRPFYRKFDPAYTYTNTIHSTAERPSTAANGQYYNIVCWLPSGGSLPVEDWGQLEVVFR
ncbi:MAG: hypothetical protein HZA31_13985 [Opitutae bacterium]|nr:hypothetical protein [Opitutae bacterium]